MNSLFEIDVYDLHILHALFQELSVTRVAEREGVTQPTISKILSRLRKALGDKLLVKGPVGLTLTERAMVLQGPIREILLQLSALDTEAGFDPVTDQRTFHVGCGDCVLPSFIARIIDRVTTQNRRMQVRFLTINPSFDSATALETGAVDLIINNHPRPREDLRTSTLYTDEVVCLMRQGHPLAEGRRLRLARYLDADHLAPNPSARGENGPISGSLMRSGYRRNIVATIPEYSLVPFVLLESDLIFTTGRQFATELVRYFPLEMVPAPTEFEPLRFYQLWHERKHNSAANRWLREQIRVVANSQFKPV